VTDTVEIRSNLLKVRQWDNAFSSLAHRTACIVYSQSGRNSKKLSLCPLTYHTHTEDKTVRTNDYFSTEDRPPTNRIHRHASLLLWPWPWYTSLT